MNLLITGGCGFIGSHYVAQKLRTDPEARIINLDSLTYAAHPDTQVYLHELGGDRYRFVHGDITSPDVTRILRDYEIHAIVNFAAESHVDRSILDPGAFVRTNVLGTENLLSAARAAGNIRFLHVSTDEVYGSLSATAPKSTESSTLDPNSPYAASKASADLLALACHRTYGQHVVVTRCTNNYGPFQFPEKLLPLVIANALEDKPIPVYGDGKQVRDWIYVEDHCSAIDLVLRQGIAGEVYNISADEERHNLDVISLVLERLAKPRSLIHFVSDRPAHDRRYGLDATKIRKELGWRPAHTFSGALDLTLAWYLENTDWWRKARNQEYFSYYQENYRGKFGAETWDGARL